MNWLPATRNACSAQSSNWDKRRSSEASSCKHKATTSARRATCRFEGGSLLPVKKKVLGVPLLAEPKATDILSAPWHGHKGWKPTMHEQVCSRVNVTSGGHVALHERVCAGLQMHACDLAHPRAAGSVFETGQTNLSETSDYRLTSRHRTLAISSPLSKNQRATVMTDGGSRNLCSFGTMSRSYACPNRTGRSCPALSTNRSFFRRLGPTPRLFNRTACCIAKSKASGHGCSALR